MVHNISAEFFDQNLVSRWTSAWLGGEETWVIGVTKVESWQKSFAYPLVGKTIHILSKVYAQNDTMRFGLVDFQRDEEIKESLIGV